MTVGAVNKGFGLGKVRLGIVCGLVVATSLLAGCGSDGPLADLGHMTERWIAAAPDPPPTASVPVSAVPVGLLATNGTISVEWINDDLGDLSPAALASSEETIIAIWSRGNREDRFVQASRSEIVAVLPALEVPALVPENVAFITSQLIFDPATGELASDPAAAFGFWSVKPYTKSRSVSQLAVLMVAIDEPLPEPVVSDTIGVPENPPIDARCDELAGSTVEGCTKVILEDDRPAWSLDVTDGWRLVWSKDGYTYDLFVRNADDADLPARMAGSAEKLMPVVSVLAGADGPEGQPAGIESDPSTETAGS